VGGGIGPTAKSSAIQRLPDDRRLATLVAFAVTLEATAVDEHNFRTRTIADRAQAGSI
jgi:hypothetical protein